MGKTQFEILDCTIRDGGYANQWRFDKKLVRETYRALSNGGIDYVEIGYRGTEKYFNPKEYGIWRFSKEEDIRQATANINGAKVAIMADYGKIEIDDFCPAAESMVDLVRMAVHKDHVSDAIILLQEIKKKGYKVALNAMGYSNYTKDEHFSFVESVQKSNLDYVYVVDSYGALFPHQIRSIFTPLLEIPHIKVGFHPHNSLQMAFANTLEAIRCGVHIIDSTIYGMGRAAGNLPTEVIVSYLEREGKDRYNSIPILNIIDRYFVLLQNEKGWGYQLPYMLSGMFDCHPDYARALVDTREYTIEDIWKALDYVRKRQPAGFSRPLLNRLIDEGIIGGSIKTESDQSCQTAGEEISRAQTDKIQIPYLNRHKGQDFLIMANGPSLKEYRDKITMFIDKYKPVTLGANYLGELFQPDYHAFNNKRRFTAYIDTVNPFSKLLIGQHISNEMILEYTNRQYDTIYYQDVLNSPFCIHKGVISTSCRTIAVLLLGVAIVMGAKRIFAVGMDGYTGLERENFHFYRENEEQEDLEMIIERHRWCSRFLEEINQYLHARDQEGIHILTPTAYKTFYKGIENYI